MDYLSQNLAVEGCSALFFLNFALSARHTSNECQFKVRFRLRIIKLTTLRYESYCSGLSKLKEDKGGEAVKLINEAQNEAKQSIPLAANFNKAEPSTPAAEHSEFDADLKICVESALKRVRHLLHPS